MFAALTMLYMLSKHSAPISSEEMGDIELELNKFFYKSSSSANYSLDRSNPMWISQDVVALTESQRARRKHEHYKQLADMQIKNIIHTLMSVTNRTSSQ